MVARALVAVVLLVLGSVSTPLRSEAAQTVQAVLDARVAAVKSGDKDGWMATVDPDAPAAFRDAQARLFDGLRSVPIESYVLEARFADRDVPRPDGWGGYRVVPDEIEFWQHRDDRLHDRFRYTAQADGWLIERLFP
jgi:pyridoxine/pyridoxamine 5'-phosphate oxidase